jgi:hypothetical protein
MKTVEDDITAITGGKITELELEDYFDDLYDYFCRSGEMPYGTAKVRTGDPYLWIYDYLDGMGLISYE